MNKIIFSDSSYIKIQGDEVLRIKKISADKATYELVGFEDYPVLIEDTRLVGLDALGESLNNDQVDAFAPKFNQPGHVTITREGTTRLVIQLSETEDKNPEFMLWIAIGMEKAPPQYSFVLCENIPYQQGKTALLSLYKRPAYAEVNLVPSASFHPFDILVG